MTWAIKTYWKAFKMLKRVINRTRDWIFCCQSPHIYFYSHSLTVWALSGISKTQLRCILHAFTHFMVTWNRLELGFANSSSKSKCYIIFSWPQIIKRGTTKKRQWKLKTKVKMQTQKRDEGNGKKAKNESVGEYYFYVCSVKRGGG